MSISSCPRTVQTEVPSLKVGTDHFLAVFCLLDLGVHLLDLLLVGPSGHSQVVHRHGPKRPVEQGAETSQRHVRHLLTHTTHIMPTLPLLMYLFANTMRITSLSPAVQTPNSYMFNIVLLNYALRKSYAPIKYIKPC